MVIFGIAALGLQPPPEAVEKYGVFQSVSIPKLFVAGVFPGLLMAGSLLIMNYILCRRRGYHGGGEGWSASTMGRALASGFWSSKMGVDDLQYIGNTFVREWTGCPQEVLDRLGVSYEE